MRPGSIISREGYDRMQSELHELRTTQRKRIAERIKTARELGDLSENTEYDDAMNEQAIVESKIASLEANLARAQIVEGKVSGCESIVVGATVTIEDVEAGEECEYQIVSHLEATESYADNSITDDSPVGLALIGKSAGEQVVVKLPNGNSINYLVKSIA
jgi:transcription elongation factor GreA